MLLRRLTRLVRWVCLAVLGAVVVAWAIGRIATDRWVWSQFLFWIPVEALVLAAVALALCVRIGNARSGRIGRRIGAISVAAALLMGAHLFLVHWGLVRLFTRPARGATSPGLRIVEWNVTAVERTEQITGTIGPLNADVAILVNPHSRPDWRAVMADFGKPTALVWESDIMVLSHLAIIRHGSLTLGLPSAPEPDPRRRWFDPGRAMFLELDTTQPLGHTTVVWVIDMPSDPRLPRWRESQRAAAAIAGWSGPSMVHDAIGNVSPEPGLAGFPAPDLVMGDFNTPRGAASVSLLTPGMTNAFDQGGAGYAASWPGYGFRYTYPIVHIDQMLVAPSLRAARYELIKPVFGYHWPQMAEVVAR